MPVLDLGRLSASEAESVIAILWRILEEYDVASPRIAVRSEGSDVMVLRLTFDETEGAERVRCTLRRLLPHIELDTVRSLMDALSAT